MPRDLQAERRSQAKGAMTQENERVQREQNGTSREVAVQDNQAFVPISHKDVQGGNTEMADAEADESSSPYGAGLQRMSGSSQHLESSDWEDEDDDSSLHPLMNRLQNRLLSRGNNSRGTSSKFDNLHPYTSILTVSNVEECVKIEDEAFPEHERCSEEKFVYRLTKCPELSLGIFSRPIPSEAARLKDPSAKLIAHVIATRSPAPAVTDASMNLPPDWKAKRSSIAAADEAEPLGHQEEGRTVCIHSVAVSPEHQQKGLGSILMKAYVQRIKDSKTADRIALLAHDPVVTFYQSIGFQNMGESACTFGGGGWNNMILDFTEQHED